MHRMVTLSGVLVVAGLVMAGPSVAAAQETSATFTKDVLPIFQRSCQKCHRAGTPAPMSLMTYEDARPWARAIKDRVTKRQMPPWHIDRSIGVYEPDPSLNDDEIATIAAWVDGGAPRGNTADAPPPVDLPALGEWTFGEPDMVVAMKEGFHIPAEGADFYPSEVVDPGLTEDKYVKWVQVIPEAYCCVHHSHVYAFMPEGEETPEDVGLGMGSNTATSVDLIEYAMGNDGDLFPDGTAKVLKAGMHFRFSSHYHPWGEDTHDRQKVGIKFYPKGEVPELLVTSHRLRTGLGNDWVMNRERVEDYILRAGHEVDVDAADMPNGALIDDNTLNSVALLSIPPNSVVRHERFWPLPQAAMIISFQPHMHFRGKRMTLEAIHLDGRREVLTDATNYEQTWQITYTYDEPHVFPKGTILHNVSWHDNTANNRHNPDPTAWVGWGSRTMDEMGHGWTDLAFMSDSQYESYMAGERLEGVSTTEGGGQ